MPEWKNRLNQKKRVGRSRSFRSRSGSLRRINMDQLMLLLSKWGLVGVIGLIILGIGGFIVLSLTLPSPEDVIRREGFSTKILDRNGEVLYDIFRDERRTAVAFDQIPENLKKATIAIEDKNFYSHSGFDPLGMVRGVSRIFTRGYAQGGSTLTQQLVKNVLLTSERSVIRKIKEFVLAIQIERKYDKDEILLLYLNEAPYGGTAWGVASAAEIYFGKEVKDLNLVESAILAGLPQSPSRYSPYSSTPDAYVGRTEQVLRRMHEDDYINDEDYQKALEDLPNVDFQPRGASFKAPHFVQYVQRILEDTYGASVVENGGLVVTTTLDLKLQEEAQKIVSTEIEEVEYLNIGNGAAVALDPQTGEILSMVGSKDFEAEDYDGQVNVTTALRQPGSAIKPITYVTALSKGYTASTMLMDVPTEFPGGAGQPAYKPENYDGTYRGPMQVRYALANSINVIAVKMVALVGIEDMLQLAYEMGLTSLQPTDELLKRVGLSVTLGGGEVRLLELANAYSAFTNGGFRIDPVAILKVEDGDGNVLEENKPEKDQRVLDAQDAYIIADILSDNNARSAVFGTNSLLNFPGQDVMVKTGTTNDLRDNWAIGGSSDIVVGVWVGNNDNSPMAKVASGISGATPIWRQIVLEALKDRPVKEFERPNGIVTATVDSVSGMRVAHGYPERTEIFKTGTEPGEDTIHVRLKVCKNDNKLATPGDVASGNYEEREYFVFKEEDPFQSVTGENKWQRGILEWANNQTDQRYKPPSEYCGSGSKVTVGFEKPKDKQENLSNTFDVEIKAESVTDISKVEIYVDNDLKRTIDNAPYKTSLSLTDGIYTLKARAVDKDGNSNENSIQIAVGGPISTPPPSPTTTPTPTPTSTAAKLDD